MILKLSQILTLSELSTVLLVDEDVSVPCLSILHAYNSVVGFGQGVPLDPGLDVVFTSKFQTFGNITRGSDERTRDVDVAYRSAQAN
jgi:hypothetical protein